MERAEIFDGKDSIILYLDNGNFHGYHFYADGKISSVNKSVLKYFDFIKLSNNRTKLLNEGDYEVILDNDTNFKHYFLNGREDFEMFYINNGEESVCYLDESISEKKTKSLKGKIFKFLGKVVICASLFLFTVHLTMDTIDFLDNKIILYYPDVPNITVNDIFDKIDASNGISNIDKSYLKQDSFFNLILPIVNESNYIKYEYNERFKLLRVRVLNQEEMASELHDSDNYDTSAVLGCVRYEKPWEIIIRDGMEFADYLDTLLHELIHICQTRNFKYNVISEACAEILSSEFFYPAVQDSYPNEVVIVKRLMGIIGVRPILEYCITGNFDLIEARTKDKLGPELYDKFKNVLSTNFPQPKVNSPTYEKYVSDKENRIRESHAILDILASKYDISPDVNYEESCDSEKYYFNIPLCMRKGIVFSLRDACELGYIKIEKLNEAKKVVGFSSYEEYFNHFNIDPGNYKIIFNQNMNMSRWFGHQIFCDENNQLCVRPIIEQIDDLYYNEGSSIPAIK